ncbi:MAG: VTT domain-containing protein [Acetobacterales bacterium]
MRSQESSETTGQAEAGEFSDRELAEAAPPNSRARKWLVRLRQARNKDLLLFVASFAETTVVPIPIEVVLIPYMLAERRRIWWIATVALAGCLAGSILGYAIGYFLFGTIGAPLIEWAGWQEPYRQFLSMFERQGFWAILALGIVPIPFQVAMLAAGAAHYSILMFVTAAVVARGIRYYGLGWLVRAFGPGALRMWRDHKITATAVAVIVLAVLWGVMQWLGGLAAGGG